MPLECWWEDTGGSHVRLCVKGYLAQTNAPPRMTLPWVHAQGLMVAHHFL